MVNRGADASIPQISLYREWLHRERGLAFCDYAAMWEWSRTDLTAFWQSVWDYHDLRSPIPPTVIVEGTMPEARWFAGAQINYARQVFRHADMADAAGQPAIIAADESGRVTELTWGNLRRQVAAFALELRRRGIGRGDVVAAYLPNIPEAVVSMLACASIGAIWTICSPDMGTPAVLARFQQTAPKVLIAVDGVSYGGKQADRAATVETIRQGLPSVTDLFVIATGKGAFPVAGTSDFHAVQPVDARTAAMFEPEWLPFDHPLWILYSSGTTGLPKAIVHGHGGVVIAACVGNMHLDLGASYSPNNFGERFHWYSATGWVMWNIQVGGLLSGTTICIYDGSPKGAAGAAEWTPLWAFAARHHVTWFGAGAAFYASCRKAGLTLRDIGDLSGIRALGSTGSPLTADDQTWGTRQFATLGTADIWWCNISGGTDIAAAFLSGNRELPATPGRMQCRHLGASVEAWDEDGRAVQGRVGELVCTQPFPSMPLFFWGDAERARYRSTYFESWEGVWRHGDWLSVEVDGSCTIAGRSDATINRHGLRMGTADIYAAVERLPAIADSLVIDLEDGAGDSKLLMFVVPGEGTVWGPELEAAIAKAIRETLSPRFIPDRFILAPAIPRTLSGKKQELPVKRLFQGWPVAKVIDPSLTDNAAIIPWYVAQADAWRAEAGMTAANLTAKGG